jgi:hypothetical protein
MSTPPERITARFHADAGFLSSVLRPRDTGVDGVTVWFFAGEPSRTESRQGPRIHVVLGERLSLESLADSVAVRLTAPPEVLGTLPDEVARQVIEFATINRKVLRRYWRGNLGTKAVLELLVRV